MIDIANMIKDRLSMQEVVERYGFEVNRAHKMLCPFHNDGHPSMHIYSDNFHCFTCGAHGDVISFVQKLYGLDFQKAISKIDIDFGLNLPIERRITLREYLDAQEAKRSKLHEKNQHEKLKEEFEKAYDNYARLDCYYMRYKPKPFDEAPDHRFMEALSGLETAKFRLDLAESRLYGFKR